jgi:DNA-binding MarR family transcriptional regulator
MDDPKWLAFYGMLQTNARVVEQVGQRMERETGLPPAWFEVLAQVYKCERRMSELADCLTLSRGGATRLVARMEEAGLVERVIPKEDRRATFARITDAGTEAFERAKPVHFAAVDELFNRHIDDEQTAVMRAAFGQILRGNGVSIPELTGDAEPAP